VDAATRVPPEHRHEVLSLKFEFAGIRQNIWSKPLTEDIIVLQIPYCSGAGGSLAARPPD
jgi:hypothetical protein